VGLQGLFGLVEEEDGIDLVVEAAEGLVRVVCPNAQSSVNPSVAVAIKIMPTIAWLPRRMSGARLP
jgi:hypothetical protein